MEKEKLLGEYCKFLKQYVPVRIRYESNGRVEACGRAACNNTHCSLSEAYKGDRSQGQDYLE